MKHLKLFEAFNSNILSKTLRYLSKDSRNNFLNEVKRICVELDFPLSELTDDYFEYLGFSNALKKVDGDNKIYKFWLNKEGDFLYETLTDGVVGDEKKVGDSIGGDEDYVGTGKVYTTYGQLDELEDRSKIIVIFRGTYKPNLATLFEDNGDLFAIHNNDGYDGGTPDYHDSEDWEQYGEYSWSLRGTDFKKIQLAIHKDDVTSDGGVEGPNYYLYNKHTQNTNHMKNKFSSRSSLSGSEFAIVFNTGKLKDYKKVSTIKSERGEMKSGAQALRNPEDIRKSNIERRLMEIAKKEFNINTFNELFNKVLFDKYILFFNLDDTIKSINQIIKLWENPVDSDDNNYMDALKKWYDTLTNETTPNRSEVNRFFGDATTNNGRDREKGAKLTLQHYGKITQDEINSKVTNTIFNTIKRLYNLRTDLLSKEATKKPNCKILSNKLQELGQLIINKVKPSTLEDIDDIVIAQEKLNSISRILLSDRYDFKKSHDVIIYWAKGLSGNDDVDRHVVEGFIDTLNQMIKLVSKL